MADMDPVAWADVEAATGPPAATEVVEYVEAWLSEADLCYPPEPYDAAKEIYDEWKTDLGEDRRLPDQGAAFVITYLLERERAIDLRGRGQGTLLKRHPGADELREMFWEQEQTLWWMAVESGVHYSLVTYWLWEEDIPLAERNLSDETARRIAAESDE
jgi:hypothetical protein